MSERLIEEYIAAHGFGDPTDDGMKLAKILIDMGDDYATAAAEVVARGLTTNPETD